MDTYMELQKSPMFQLSLASKELFHSNFLAWIGSWDYGEEKKRGKNHPFRQLMQELGASHALDDSWGTQWYVAREYRNFDLCVLSRMPDEFQEEKDQENDEEEGNNPKNDVRVLLVLENKVKSIPNIEQLQEYQEKVLDINFDIVKGKIDRLQYKWQLSDKDDSDETREGKRKASYGYQDKKKYASNMRKVALNKMKEHVDFLLLSMSEDFPDMASIKDDTIWRRINYNTYLSALKGLSAKGINNSILEDYCKQLGLLLELHEEWTDDDKFLKRKFLYFEKKDNNQRSYRFDYLDLKQLRIHDLFQKQRYAKMCLILKNKISNVVKKERLNLACVNHMDVAEVNMQNNRVFIGFNYLHGEPLLDIWLRTDEYYYTIQVQGDSYEHGIQQLVKSEGVKSKGVNSKALWDSIWGQNGIANMFDDWNWICPFSGDPFDLSKGPSGLLKEKEQKPYFPIVNGSKKIFADNNVYPNPPRKRQGKSYPFLKYELDNGVTFIYQYRKLSDQAHVGAVLNYIVDDFKALCDMLNLK